jgi:DNA-binding SARP family transcriptional activator
MQALLAYLLLQRPRSQPRELLADLFWGDQPADRAYSCLNTALWRLRQVLEPSGVARGAYLVTTSAGEVSFNWESNYWLDVAAFEDQARRLLATPLNSLSAADAQATSQVLQLYAGNLLEGFYDDWVLREREYLRQLQLSSLARLVTFHKERQEHQLGIDCARQILSIEPLSEEAHRDLMLLYTESGQRGLAIRQYETCRELLAKELAIAPMTETQALYHKIRLAQADPGADAAAAPSDVADKQQLAQLLAEAMSALEEVRRLLQRAMNAG